MALDAEYVARLEDCRVRERVGAGRRGLFDNWNVVAMGKVHVGVCGQPCKYAGRSNSIERIPTHMRNTRGKVKPFDFSKEDTEATLLRRFFAGFEKPLETEADSEKWHARFDAANERVTHVHFVESAQHLAEVP